MAHKGKPALVEVEWLDARSTYGELSLREAPSKVTLIRRVSVGYLVLKDRERLLLAHTFDPAVEEDELDGGCDWTVIPRGWVQKITELAPAGTTTADTPPPPEIG